MKTLEIQERRKEYARQYRRKNLARILANEQAWRDRNRERIRFRHCVYMRKQRWEAFLSREPLQRVLMWEWRRRAGQFGPKFALW